VPDALRVRRRQLSGGQAAEGVAGDVGPIDLDRVQPAGQPLPELVRVREAAEGREVDDVEPPLRRELLEERRPPAPRAAEPVHEQQRPPLAGDAVPHALAVDLDGSALDLGRPARHGGSLSGGRGVVRNG